MLLGRMLRQAKIEDFGGTAIRHKDIGGLYIPVDDPFRVGAIQPICNLKRLK